MAIQLHFMLALSGNTLGVVRVNLPRRPDLELLSQQLGQSVHTYLVDCSGEPLRQFVESAGSTCKMCHLSLVQSLSHHAVLVLPLLLFTQFWLRNLCQCVRITLKPGWRRRYRKFTRAAAEMAMQALSCRRYVAHRAQPATPSKSTGLTQMRTPHFGCSAGICRKHMCVNAAQTWSLRTAEAGNLILQHARAWAFCHGSVGLFLSTVPLLRVRTCVLQKPGSATIEVFCVESLISRQAMRPELAIPMADQ